MRRFRPRWSRLLRLPLGVLSLRRAGLSWLAAWRFAWWAVWYAGGVLPR